jgi:hypothetical protein
MHKFAKALVNWWISKLKFSKALVRGTSSILTGYLIKCRYVCPYISDAFPWCILSSLIGCGCFRHVPSSHTHAKSPCRFGLWFDKQRYHLGSDLFGRDSSSYFPIWSFHILNFDTVFFQFLVPWILARACITEKLVLTVCCTNCVLLHSLTQQRVANWNVKSMLQPF